MNLSIIITAHDEGILLHKALLSVFSALSFASIDDYEVIIHIDNETEETKKYLNSSAFNFKNVKVYKNSFGDLGLSRNFCIKKASGKYVFILDADDLISENFFKVALEILGKKDKVLIHPESCLSFEDAGKYRNLWRMTSSQDIKSDAFIMLEKNKWISSIIGDRNIFLSYPYKPTCNGYGNEDYALNMDTINAGIRHLVAPGTVHFYRKSPSSLLAKSTAKGLTQRKSDLFDIAYWKNFSSDDIRNKDKATLSKNEIVKRKARKLYLNARNNRVLNVFITPVATVARKATGIKLIKPPRIPDDIFEQWKNISEIEPQLFPTKDFISKLSWYDERKNNLASDAYLKLCKQAKFTYADYIFIVPWVTVGGADKVLINYLKALRVIHPKWKVAVITTLPSKNEWAAKLPKNTCLFDYGNLAKDLYDDNERDILLSRLIVQLGAKKIHIINSEAAYNWAYRHSSLVESEYDLRLSLFCHDIIPHTKGKGIYDYADPLASRIESFVTNVFTDNNAVIDRLVSNYGFRRGIIKTHFQPFTDDIDSLGRNAGGKQLRVLWASRICAQKRPELVVEIAKQLNPDDCRIDMYGKMDSQYNKKMFSGVSALKYCGSFNGLDSINLDQYDCFLYTSFIDGLPNTILEIAAKGLPIIASDAGGIKDFVIDKETGMLVSDKNTTAYVKALEYIRKDPESAKKFANNATRLLKKRHSWEAFIETIKEDF